MTSTSSEVAVRKRTLDSTDVINETHDIPIAKRIKSLTLEYVNQPYTLFSCYGIYKVCS